MQDMDDKNFTVFVPSDEAFKLVDQAKLLGLTEEEVDRVVLFHIYEDMVLTYDELACGEKLRAVNGDNSRTKCSYVGEGSKQTIAVKYQNGNGNVSKQVDLLVLVFIQFLSRAFLFSSCLIHSYNVFSSFFYLFFSSSFFYDYPTKI